MNTTPTETLSPAAPKVSWTLVVMVYLGLVVAFGLIALYLISAGRDPFLGSVRIPSESWFQYLCALLSAVSGLSSLFLCGVIVDKGSTNQMVALVLVLPLILILLDAVSLID